MKKVIPILFIISSLATCLYGRWGWSAHRFINDRAVEHLPAAMSFWQDHRDYLSEHAVDPDTDNFPGYYHYIDIDYYPEFFTGTLPHTWQGMIDLYGQSIMEDNGVIPWVIDWWITDLVSLMQAEDWNSVWQIAAELGHYVADSHQPLHLTLNYNGQLTDNYGIHSRYETHMINPYLDEILLSDTTGSYWESPLDSVFNYIEDVFPIVDLVMVADDRASQEDSDYNATYYSMMWEDLGDTTIWALQKAVVDLASIWYTAWIDAGSPYPAGVGIDPVQAPEQFMLNAYPNPFNAGTMINFSLETPMDVEVWIADIRGRVIEKLAAGEHSAGSHSVFWNGLDQGGDFVSSGVYLATLRGTEKHNYIKLTLVK